MNWKKELEIQAEEAQRQFLECFIPTFVALFTKNEPDKSQDPDPRLP
jgi:hypothetical protein